MIRPGRPEDASNLPAVEQSAGEVYRTVGMDFVSDHALSPVEHHLSAMQDGLHWVVVDAEDRLIGFCMGMAYGATLYIAELAIAGSQQRQGLGRILMLAVIADSKTRGFSHIALRTFRGVAWNAPFYASLGFIEGDLTDIARRSSGFAPHERRAGINPENRCTMILQLA